MSTARIGRAPTCDCGTCRKCRHRAYMREWYSRKTPEERRAWAAKRDPARVREEDRRKMAKRRAEGTPEQKLRITARNEVRKARARGDLVRQPCEVCGDISTHAHHEDYQRPLDVRWLCRPHHADRHKATMED